MLPVEVVDEEEVYSLLPEAGTVDAYLSELSANKICKALL